MVNDKESREQKFKRIASRRTQRILNDFRLLGNCSNKGIYKYNGDDVSKIFSAIEKEIRQIRALFSNKSKENKFTL